MEMLHRLEVVPFVVVYKDPGQSPAETFSFLKKVDTKVIA